MTFPTISFKYNDVEDREKLSKIVNQKFEPLGKLIQEETSPKCEVEFQKVASQQNGKIFRFEANLYIDGTLHRADAVEESFEEAIDEVRDELNKKLRRSKDKSKSLLRRAGQQMKERFFSGKSV